MVQYRLKICVEYLIKFSSYSSLKYWMLTVKIYAVSTLSS